MGERPIIVIGCPRSGTTLLSAMLNGHPELAIPPETRFQFRAYNRRRRFGDLNDPKARRALGRLITRPLPQRGRFHALGLDRRQTVGRIVERGSTVGAAFAEVFRSYAQSQGKSRWGDKRPAYWRRLNVIHELYPDAQFVNVVRDGRACVASLQRVPWWTADVDGAVSAWVQWEACTRRAARRLGPEQFHDVRYEELIRDPEPVLRALCDFLGVPFDARMLDNHASAKSVLPKAMPWHANVERDVDATRASSWEHELDPAVLGLIERVAGRALRRRGYELTHRGTAPGLSAVLRYQKGHVRRAVGRRRQVVQDRWDGWRYGHPVSYLST